MLELGGGSSRELRLLRARSSESHAHARRGDALAELSGDDPLADDRRACRHANLYSTSTAPRRAHEAVGGGRGRRRRARGASATFVRAGARLQAERGVALRPLRLASPRRARAWRRRAECPTARSRAVAGIAPAPLLGEQTLEHPPPPRRASTTRDDRRRASAARARAAGAALTPRRSSSRRRVSSCAPPLALDGVPLLDFVHARVHRAAGRPHPQGRSYRPRPTTSAPRRRPRPRTTLPTPQNGRARGRPSTRIRTKSPP